MTATSLRRASSTTTAPASPPPTSQAAGPHPRARSLPCSTVLLLTASRPPERLSRRQGLRPRRERFQLADPGAHRQQPRRHHLLQRTAHPTPRWRSSTDRTSPSARSLDVIPGSQDFDDYMADRALDLKLTRTCGLDILFTGVVPKECAGLVADQGSCTGKKFDAVLFPANFGANPPARAGYPSVIVPGGFFTPTLAQLPAGFNARAFALRRDLLGSGVQRAEADRLRLRVRAGDAPPRAFFARPGAAVGHRGRADAQVARAAIDVPVLCGRQSMLHCAHGIGRARVFFTNRGGSTYARESVSALHGHCMLVSCGSSFTGILGTMGTEPAAYGHRRRGRPDGNQHPRRHRLRSVHGEGGAGPIRDGRPAGALPDAADCRQRRVHGVQDRPVCEHQELAGADVVRAEVQPG